MDATLQHSPRLSVLGIVVVVGLAGVLLPGLRSGASTAATIDDSTDNRMDTGSSNNIWRGGSTWVGDGKPEEEIATDLDEQASTAKVEESPPSAPNRITRSESPLDARIRGPVQAQQSDLNDIITLLGSETGLPYTIDQGVSARVTFSLQDPSVREILDTILPGQGLDYLVTDHGVIRIGRAATILRMKHKPGELVTAVFSLKYVSGDDVKESLEKVKTDQGRITFDPRTNSIVATDTRNAIAKMRKILKERRVAPETPTSNAKPIQPAPPKPTPTPRPLAQNYKIRNILGSSAILVDYRLMPIVVHEGQTVDDQLGNFRVMEVDAKGRRVRVKHLSTGQERWITEWERKAPSRRRRR